MKLELPADRIAVKICGITNRDDALAAVDAGADLLGFNTWSGSKRFMNLGKNADWIAAIPRPVVRVALLVNATPEETQRVAAFGCVDALQFHGDEDAAFCRWAAGLGKPIIKALRAKDRAVLEHAGNFSTTHVLLDAHVPGEFGGTGARVDLALACEFKRSNPALSLWLAGGLTPENIGEAVRAVRPAVADVSSGVECEPGRKDAAKMRALAQAARRA
ncbi:MAG: phosphoribosylanthranilate isomerase [Chthoniobacteraceae bacterium]